MEENEKLETKIVAKELSSCESNKNKSKFADMVLYKFGFVPTSCWWFNKTHSLQVFINDELAENTYSTIDVAAQRLSQFNPVIAEKIIKIWSNKHDKILDPFAGRCRALMAQFLERQYVGYEISKTVCNILTLRINQIRLNKYLYTPKIINSDSNTMKYNEEFDFIFSCPPYWNVEDYTTAYNEKMVGQLSDISNYNEFLVAYTNIIQKCYTALKKGKYAVFVVSDIRREKKLIPFSMHTINIFQKVGFELHDIIINKLNSLAILGVGQALENGYTPKIHEYILVFRKN